MWRRSCSSNKPMKQTEISYRYQVFHIVILFIRFLTYVPSNYIILSSNCKYGIGWKQTFFHMNSIYFADFLEIYLKFPNLARESSVSRIYPWKPVNEQIENTNPVFTRLNICCTLTLPSSSFHCSPEVVVSDASLYGRWGVQGSAGPHRMELQHRQQSQDHKGGCAHSLSIFYIFIFFPSLWHTHSSHPSYIYMHAHNRSDTISWPTSTFIVLYLSPHFLPSVLLVSTPICFSFAAHIFSFSRPISLCTFSSRPILDLTSNILWGKKQGQEQEQGK